MMEARSNGEFKESSEYRRAGRSNEIMAIIVCQPRWQWIRQSEVRRCRCMVISAWGAADAAYVGSGVVVEDHRAMKSSVSER